MYMYNVQWRSKHQSAGMLEWHTVEWNWNGGEASYEGMVPLLKIPWLNYLGCIFGMMIYLDDVVIEDTFSTIS